MTYSAGTREIQLLFELSQALDATTDIGRALDVALALMAQYMHMMRGSITLISPHTGEIRIETAYGLKLAEKQRGRYSLGEGVTGRVIQTGRPMVVSNISQEPLFLNRTRSRNLAKDTISFICVPIRLQDQVLGALSVDRLFANDRALEEDVRLLSIITSLLARVARERQKTMDERAAAIEEDMRLRNSRAPSSRPDGFVGNSDVMSSVYEQIAQVGPSGSTVLLYGESGTGKELAAQAIHAVSGRRGGPFVSLNCAALPENLIESELFGHEKGAFTGAISTRKGRFELADGGTLFLDEVGELSFMVQAKLLRVIQERHFERLGSMETCAVDVRIIAATNRSLPEMVEEGTFRRDLYYRLNVFPIKMPPLRERSNDILPLAMHFLKKYGRANGKHDLRLSLSCMDILQRHDWPGNIRELENCMERAVLLVGQEGLISPQHLPTALQGAAGEAARSDARVLPSGTLQERLEELERACIKDALEQSRGNIGKAARILGLTERIMGLRMRKYALSYKLYRQRTMRQEEEN